MALPSCEIPNGVVWCQVLYTNPRNSKIKIMLNENETNSRIENAAKCLLKPLKWKSNAQNVF